MDYFFPTLLIGFSGYAIYNCVNIANYCVKAFLYWPGEGEIYKKTNPKLKTTNYYIKNPEKDYRLNYIKAPCFDLDVAFFLDDINYEDKFIDSFDFENNYGGHKIYKLENHGMGVIEDVYHTKNIKKGKVHGFIQILSEDRNYMFTINEGVIDMQKIFDQYESDLFDSELSEDNT